MTAKKRLAVAGLALGPLIVGAYLALFSGGGGSTQEQDPTVVVTADTGQHVTCGVERWPVKSLTDANARLVRLTPIPGSIAALSAVMKAPTNAKARLSAETQAYTLTAKLTGFKLEADSDIHAVISDGSHTMIVEFPNPACAKGSVALAQITKARADFIALCGNPTPSFATCSKQVTVSGVLFLDFLHGQTGVAPNGVELHPVLSIAAPRPPVPPAALPTPTATMTPPVSGSGGLR